MSFFSNLLADASTVIKISPDEIGSPKVSADSGTLHATLMTVYLWAGIVCVVIIIIGGLRYTISNDDSGMITSAKNTIMYALIGLVVIIMAAAITQFILGKF